MPIDFDKLRQRQTGRTWSPAAGPNIIRVLPHTSRYFTEMLGDFAYGFRVHYFRAEGRDTQVTRCPRDANRHCLACELASKYRDSSDPGIAKAAADVKAVQRRLMNILDLAKPAAGIQAYECGNKVYGDILEICTNVKWGDVFHPETGRNFTLTFTPASQAKSGYNDYSCMPDPDKTSVKHILDTIPGWEGQLDELEGLIPPILSDDEIRDSLGHMGFPVPGVAAPNPVPPPAPPVTAAQAPPPPVTVAAPAPTLPAAPPPSAPATKQVAAWDPTVELRADGKPVCFGQYDPETHPCHKCPVQPDCQMEFLNL